MTIGEIREAVLGDNPPVKLESLLTQIGTSVSERLALISDEYRDQQARRWATVFNQGVAAYQRQDLTAAISRWEQAALIDNSRPETYLNLGVAYVQQNQNSQAVESYRRVLVLTESTQDTTALNTRRNALAALSSVGGKLFDANDFSGAAEVFGTLTEVEPRSREGWNNYAVSLYRQENWQELIPTAQRLIEIDPLNRNANVFLFQAYKRLQQNEQAIAVLERIEAMPVYVDNLQLRSAAGRSVVTGTVEGNTATAGSQVQLRFTFFGPSGELGIKTAPLSAPSNASATQFEVAFGHPIPVTAFRYEERDSS